MGVGGKGGVIHSALAHFTACHLKVILHPITQVLWQLTYEGSVVNIIIALGFTAKGKGGHSHLAAQHPCRKQRRIGAAGNIKHTVGIAQNHLL